MSFANTVVRHIGKIAVLLLTCVLMPVAAQSAPAPSLDLSEYRGKVVYLDFWASWCAPCLQSFPWMNQVQRALGPDGLVVVAINVDRDKASAQRFLAEKIPTFRIVYDADGQIAKSYDIKDMPTSLVIGRDGKTRYVHSGFRIDRNAEYLTHIREALNDKSH